MASITPALNFPPELLLRAQPVQIVFLDVDGVFTDGGLYLSEQGETLKRFHTLDGQGLKMLQQVGIIPVVITGRDSTVLRARLQDLGIAHSYFGVHDKRAVAQSCLSALGLDWPAAAAMGDDWPDLPMMQRAAFRCAPTNAHAEVKALVHYVTPQQGGHGALRELCDLLLVARGSYGDLLKVYTQ